MSLIVGVTGAEGLIGWQTAVFLKTIPDVELKLATRVTFNEELQLEAFVKSCDVIFHFAGMNRGSDTEVAQTNIALIKTLIAALEKVGSTAHLIFSSSTHIKRETLYGQSKRECAALLEAWALRAGALFTNMVLPNVFGERGKPFYNSVVSTFCHQIALGETPTVHQDAQLEQIHAQAVARAFWDVVQNKQSGEVWLAGQQISVLSLLEKIRGFQELYALHIIPDVRNDFDRDLFNTYRSYLYPSQYPRALTLHSDYRGSLFESVKTLNGGQTFLSTTKSGITRGNHYHTRKVERFLVVSGEAEIRVRRVFDAKVQVLEVSGTQPSYVDIPTLHTHNITNVGSGELITLFWTHEFYNPSAPDTMMELV
jgi:UDP-2-acetamido-2,6-beta-L-arabino-hexul-4-ose reductase